MIGECELGLWRDTSGRLTFDQPGVSAEAYVAICRQLADVFGLTPSGDMIIGPEQMFWGFQRGQVIIGLDWDIWMEFMVVAKSVESEALVTDIAAWFERQTLRYVKRRWDENRGDEHDDFGHSWWYFEIDPGYNVIRQIEQYDNGLIVGYDSQLLEDELGGLSTEPLETSLDGFEFTNAIEFNNLWETRRNA